MSKEKELEKKFSEYLDRMLAGEEIEAGPDVDEDMRTALAFAKKMADLRRSPSPEFLLQSKARLVKKLIGLEEAGKAKPKRNWFTRLAAQPIWQAAGIIVLLAVAGVVVWKSGVFWNGEPPQKTTTVTTIPNTTTVSTTTTIATTTATTTYTTTSTPTVSSSTVTATTTTSVSSRTSSQPATTTITTTKTSTTTTVTVPNAVITVQGRTDKASYTSGEQVKIDIALTNVTGQTIQIELPPAITILQMPAGKPVYTIIPVRTTVTLSPDGTVNYEYSWDQKDNNGNLVQADSYSLEIGDVIYQGNNLQLIFTNPVLFNIQAGANP